MRDLLAYLRLVHNPSTRRLRSASSTCPPRGIGAKTRRADLAARRRARHLAARRSRSGWPPASATPRCPTSPRCAARQALEAIRGAARPPDQRARRSGTSRPARRDPAEDDAATAPTCSESDADDAEERWENVAGAAQRRARSTTTSRASTRSRFLEDVALVADADDPGGGDAGRGHADHAARREGPRVPGRVHAGHGGGRAAALALARRPGADGGGAAPLLRRHDAREGTALPAPRAPPLPARTADGARSPRASSATSRPPRSSVPRASAYRGHERARTPRRRGVAAPARTCPASLPTSPAIESSTTGSGAAWSSPAS